MRGGTGSSCSSGRARMALRWAGFGRFGVVRVYLYIVHSSTAAAASTAAASATANTSTTAAPPMPLVSPLPPAPPPLPRPPFHTAGAGATSAVYVSMSVPAYGSSMFVYARPPVA